MGKISTFHILPQILIIVSYFSSNFFLIFFLILVLREGESPTREGPGYPTGKELHQFQITFIEDGSLQVLFLLSTIRSNILHLNDAIKQNESELANIKVKI